MRTFAKNLFLALLTEVLFVFCLICAVAQFLIEKLGFPVAQVALGVNTLGALSGTLILQEALQLTFRQRPLLKMISMGFRDLDGQAGTLLKGQTATSRLFSVATVNDFGTGATARGDTDVSLTLNGFKEVQHSFTPTEYNSTNRDLIRESAQPIAVALANHIVDSVRNLWNETNFPNTDSKHAPVTVGSAWSRANTTRPFRKAMQKAGMPKRNRFQLFNSDVYDSLLGDTLIVSALNNPSNQDAIRSGILPGVDGVAIDEYPDISANAGDPITVVGVNSTGIFTATAHDLVTGDRVNLLTITSGLSSLTALTSYYVIRVDNNTFKLATTAANAAAGTATALGSDGGGTIGASRIGFAGTPDSTIYVGRAPKNPTEMAPNLPFPGVCDYIQDPVTGFQVLVTQWIDAGTLQVNNRICWLEGYAVGNPNNGLLLYKN